MGQNDENEFDLERAKRSRFDPVVDRHRHGERNTNWLAIAVAVLSIVVQVGTFFWYGGRLSQRVETLEAIQMDARRRADDLSNDNGKQNVTLGIIGQQYGEISRRLDGIERKLDNR